MDKPHPHLAGPLHTSRFFQVCFEPEDEGAGGPDTGFDFAAPTEALTLDRGAQILANSMNPERERAPNGQFSAKRDKEAEADPKVVDLKTGKPAQPDDAVKAEADEDEDPEFEIPGEEGAEPVRRKLSELWDRFDKAADLEKEVETLREQSGRAPAEYTQGLQEVVAARSNYLQGLELVTRMLNPQPPPVQMLDPSHQAYDPDGYRTAYSQYELGRGAVERLRVEREALAKQQHLEQDTLVRAYLARERESLHKAWPEAKDPAIAAQFRTDLKKIYGFNDQEIEATTDHRMFLVVRDALKLRALEAKQAEAVKVVRQKPKLVKGAARTTTDPKAAGRSTAMRSLAQSGSVNDAVQALKGLI